MDDLASKLNRIERAVERIEKALGTGQFSRDNSDRPDLPPGRHRNGQRDDYTGPYGNGVGQDSR